MLVAVHLMLTTRIRHDENKFFPAVAPSKSPSEGGRQRARAGGGTPPPFFVD